MRTTHRRALRALVGLAAVATLAACGSGETTSTRTAASSPAASTSTLRSPSPTAGSRPSTPRRT
ncbi:hypothetical protein [Janibacter melonis]|uniref:hypothetical protein n=1 Tax=Janibacter melonis TaxID=262209 RepID=UPI002094CA29|nr:hypothetical protein [Janibacter melonis]